MATYEYKVVPAPAKGEKTRGVKGPEGRFAFAIERLMNEMAAEGWEYQRAETLPSEERSGLTSSQTVWRNLLVFRRPRGAETAEPPDTLEGRRLAAAPDLVEEDDETEAPGSAAPEAAPAMTPGEEAENDAAPMRLGAPITSDNGVEDTLSLDGPSSILADRAARLRQSSAAE
ncbi:DUF4177 domain-containing protein [Salipiger sp. P9]|uniref:DUF4177 domain-containing protein n=1 Tax=Salipiger pentaromativorans TaxID=2943193 RepID=UPI0021570301|nr:DUF4177 domain-containing protein [Salipiger pentaromativorans]MCR8546418.1 DUF4177 domain-containing protein [Salipiger pentaromativorans]